MVVWDGITVMRDMATAVESGDQVALVTLSSAGMVARSVHRSTSTGAVARSGRSSGRNTRVSFSPGWWVRAQPERTSTSTKTFARPFPLLTRAIKDAQRRIGNGHVRIEAKRYESERASDALRARRRRAHREDEDGTEHQMDDESSRSLTREIADRDLVAVHEKLERLDHDVADEERAERLACGVARHPVDDAESDECRSDIARED